VPQPGGQEFYRQGECPADPGNKIIDKSLVIARIPHRLKFMGSILFYPLQTSNGNKLYADLNSSFKKPTIILNISGDCK